MSMWNPPPGNRKLHGDLLYLYAVTIEQKHFHITASAKGFYVNQYVDMFICVLLNILNIFFCFNFIVNFVS